MPALPRQSLLKLAWGKAAVGDTEHGGGPGAQAGAVFGWSNKQGFKRSKQE